MNIVFSPAFFVYAELWESSANGKMQMLSFHRR